jgi:hypothetical protein
MLLDLSCLLCAVCEHAALTCVLDSFDRGDDTNGRWGRSYEHHEKVIDTSCCRCRGSKLCIRRSVRAAGRKLRLALAHVVAACRWPMLDLDREAGDGKRLWLLGPVRGYDRKRSRDFGRPARPRAGAWLEQHSRVSPGSNASRPDAIRPPWSGCALRGARPPSGTRSFPPHQNGGTFPRLPLLACSQTA